MTLDEYLKEVKERADKATPGKRFEREDLDYYQGRTYIGSGPMRYLRKDEPGYAIPVPRVSCAPELAQYFEIDILRVESERDKEFLLYFSPDEIKKLIKIVEVQNEGLHKIMRAGTTMDGNWPSADVAYEIFGQVEKILEGEK